MQGRGARMTDLQSEAGGYTPPASLGVTASLFCQRMKKELVAPHALIEPLFFPCKYSTPFRSSLKFYHVGKIKAFQK